MYWIVWYCDVVCVKCTLHLQRPSAMSFGSYQQFCEQRRHTTATNAVTAGDVGIGFDIQLPSRYPAAAAAAAGTSLSPRPPPQSNFYSAAPGPGIVQPHHPAQLPSSFFTGPNLTSRPMPGITVCDVNNRVKSVPVSE